MSEELDVALERSRRRETALIGVLRAVADVGADVTTVMSEIALHAAELCDAAIGTVVNLAARICSIAIGGQVLVLIVSMPSLRTASRPASWGRWRSKS